VATSNIHTLAYAPKERPGMLPLTKTVAGNHAQLYVATSQRGSEETEHPSENQSAA